MAEPVIGAVVRFREQGAIRLGTVRDVVTAGARRRVRIGFEADGQRWETHRDLADVVIDEQPSLFQELTDA